MIELPRHDNVRGIYVGVNTLPDTHPDSLAAIALGKGLTEQGARKREFTFNDLMFMYEVIKKYGLHTEEVRSTPEFRNRLLHNFGIICDLIKER